MEVLEMMIMTYEGKYRRAWRGKDLMVWALAALIAASLVLAAASLALAAPFNWVQVNADGFGSGASNRATYAMQAYNGYLYTGTYNNSGTEVWRWNGSAWLQVNTAGFGDANNTHVYCMAVYGGKLYAGTWNMTNAAEVWAYDGTHWAQSNADGFGNVNNLGVFSLAEYGGNLYAITMNQAQGCEVWAFDGTNWNPSATAGFGDANNSYGYNLAVHDGSLYAGTMNYSTGCEVWRYNGTSWGQVNADGFGDAHNLCHSMASYGDNLYVGTYNGFSGSEVWRYNGTSWLQVNADGFGDANNVTSRAMIVYDSRLYLGTQNTTAGGGVWGYDGANWEQVNTGGFGDVNNARCYGTAVYGNNLYVGTYNTVTGVEVWRNRAPAFVVTKTAPTQAEPGESITYTVTISNTGDAEASGVSYTDAIPTHTSVVAGSVTCSDTGATIASEDPVEITGITVPVSGAVTINFDVNITPDTAAGTIVSNQGFAHYNGRDIPSDDPGKPGPDNPTETEVVAPPGKVLGSTSWFLAEGSTGAGFDTWVLLQNPQGEAAHVEVTFTTLEGPRPAIPLVMSPRSRATLSIQNYVPDDFHVSTIVESDIPIAVERSMYWDKRYWGESNVPGNPWPYEMKGGHSNLGTPMQELSDYHFFPEGATAGGFDTWILLVNPGNTAATTQVSLMTPQGVAVRETVVVPARSRQTFNVDQYVPDKFEVATEVVSDTPIAAERSMYWDLLGRPPYESMGGHSNSGASETANEWYMAEGATGGSFETYILIQNPGEETAQVTATFLNAGGVAARTRFDMGPRSRATLRASDYVPDDFQVSTQVTSDRPIVAERSMYWDMSIPGAAYSARDGHSTAGVFATGSTWMVPEGSTGGGFDSWVLVTNTGDEETEITVIFMTPDGPLPPQVITMLPDSRTTIHVNAYVEDNFHVSTFIDSEGSLVVERAMYWNRNEWKDIQPYQMMGGNSSSGLDP
jgi:uncharacterized repeat protein (TIGR01451 family)